MALVYHMNAFSQSRIPIKYDLLQRQRHFSTEPVEQGWVVFQRKNYWFTGLKKEWFCCTLLVSAY
jgi:hypothetical protein